MEDTETITEPQTAADLIGTATYDPADNKLRLYPFRRLDAEVYAKIKAAGFSWAPKQELFVAPSWSPGREDLLVALCGEIGDEDSSLVDRAEQRADRFTDYSANRQADGDSADATAKGIMEHIPMGQPILVGHHSERHARRDQERIRQNIGKAVQMWKQSDYWTRRADAARSHARYKELPAVRARRIKTLEAEQRKMQKNSDVNAVELAAWGRVQAIPNVADQLAAALALANTGGYRSYSFPLAKYPRNPPASQYEGPMGIWSALDGGVITAAQAAALVTASAQEYAPRCARWLEHLNNRLAYERAMLAASGGTDADKTKPEKGGACKCWAFRDGYSYIQKVNKVSVTVLDNWGNGGANFTRTIPFDKLTRLMTRAQVEELRAAGRLADNPTKTGFYVSAELAGQAIAV
jgi:hypothetical protein